MIVQSLQLSDALICLLQLCGEFTVASLEGGYVGLKETEFSPVRRCPCLHNRRLQQKSCHLGPQAFDYVPMCGHVGFYFFDVVLDIV